MASDSKVSAPSNVFTEAGRIRWTDSALVLLRVAFGAVMLRKAWVLTFEGGWDAFPNLGAIVPSVVQGPFSDLLFQIYGNPIALIGMILGFGFVGVSLISGLFVRLGALTGSVMAISFYLSSLPPVDGWVNTHVLYILGFAVVSIAGSGYRWGVDGIFKKFEAKHPWLRYLTG